MTLKALRTSNGARSNRAGRKVEGAPGHSLPLVVEKECHIKVDGSTANGLAW